MILKNIQIRIVNHCNLNCKYCGSCCNVDEEKGFVSIEQFERDLTRLKHFFSDIEKIKLLGGEPLLHTGLSEIVKITRRIYNKTQIELATNGLLLMKLENSVYEAFKKADVIINISMYEPFKCVKEEVLGFLDDKGVKYTIHSVDKFYKSKLLSCKSQIEKSWDICLCKNCLDYSDGELRRCSLGWGLKKLNNQFGTEFVQLEGEDYINIYKEEDVKHFMKQINKPSHLCGYCSDSELKWFDWESASKTVDISNYIIE